MTPFVYDREKPAKEKAWQLTKDSRGQALFQHVMRPDNKYVIAELVQGECMGFYACHVSQGKVSFGLAKEAKP